jgi:Inorganic pyrophosphatase
LGGAALTPPAPLSRRVVEPAAESKERVVDVDVVIEIPQGSRNKYEFDPAAGRIRLDRMPFTSTGYPEDYGFVPQTVAEDGDPLDALVLLDEPTFPGCEVRARVVAVFWMLDELGPDAKLPVKSRLSRRVLRLRHGPARGVTDSCRGSRRRDGRPARTGRRVPDGPSRPGAARG